MRFIPEDIHIKPIFITPDFAVFDKPEKLLVHPKGKYYHKNLLDSIKFHCNIDSNPINRLDRETSGILLASMHKQSEIALKRLFQTKQVEKTYIAYVKGNCKDTIINNPILKQSRNKDLGIRMKIDSYGKEAYTVVKAISYDKINNTTLIKIYPLTGRTHQIRKHLSYIGHNIVGESLYGVDDILARDFIDGKIQDKDRKHFFGASRLMLHSYKIKFKFNNTEFIIKSKKELILD